MRALEQERSMFRLWLGLGILLTVSTALPTGPPAIRQKPRLDAYGDPLPPGATARLGTVRLRHAGYVECAVFSRDGKTLTSSGSDDWIRVWEVATGRQLRAYRRQGTRPPRLASAAFSRDGTLLALASARMENSTKGGKVLLHDGTTGKFLREWPIPEGGANTASVVFSPDARFLATGDDRGKIHVWETASGKRRLLLEWGRVRVTGLAFSPDSRLLAAGNGNDGVALWEAATGKRVSLLRTRGPEADTRNIFEANLAFSPDGNLLATLNCDDAIRLWAVKTGKVIHRIPSPMALGTRFSPDGKTLVIDGVDGNITLVQTETGKKAGTIHAHQGWDLASFLSMSPMIPSISQTSTARVEITPDGRTLATWGWESAICLWDMATCKERNPSDNHRRRVDSVAFAPDGRTLVSAGEDSLVRLWDLARGTTLRTYRVHPLAGRMVDFSADGKLLAVGGLSDDVRLWEAGTGKRVSVFFGKPGRRRTFSAPGPFAIIPARGQIASISYRELDIWDLETARWRFSLEDLAVDRISVHGQRLAVVSNSSRTNEACISLWDLDKGKSLARFPVERPVEAAALSPDGRNLATTTREGDILLWELATGKVRGQFKGRGCVQFSPDGSILATATDEGAVLLWDIGTGKELLRLPGHRGPVNSVAFSADGTRLASGSEDTTVLVWDLTRLVRRDQKHQPGLTQEALGKLWEDLKADDARRAYRAVNGLVAHPVQALSLLHARARPAVLDRERVRQLLEGLDSPRFATRVEAEAGLLDLGGLVEPELHKVLQGRPSLEMRRRVERILERLREPFPPREDLRSIRLVEVLERIGSAAARKLLVDLASGSPLSRLTQEAKAALQRFAKRS
jgi:WD40 repeat protein